MMKIQDFFRLNNSFMRLLAVFISVIVFAHIIACFWYFIAKLEGFQPESWVVSGGYIDEEHWSLYMASLYWTYTTISTVGYGDITAETMLERILSISLMLFGVCFFSFTIGSLASIFNRMDSKEGMLNEKMAIIDEFAKEAKLSNDLKVQLRHAVQYSTEKTGFTWSDKLNIFNELPKELRYEAAIAMH